MPQPGKKSIFREIRSLLALVGAVFAFHGLAAKPYYVPSASMVPALVNGDRIVVSKYPYGWSWASVPFHLLPPSNGRILGRLPSRGDVVTVVRPGSKEDLIKRVIGLPGDFIEVRHGIVVLNGTPLPRTRRPDALIPVDANFPCDEPVLAPHRTRDHDGKAVCRLPVYRETLPDGRSYDTIDLGDTRLPGGYLSQGDNYGPIQVPEDHVFLMGDNRDDSADSRFPLSQKGLGGPVPVANLGGRAEFITHSFDGSGRLLNPVSWFSALRDRGAISLRPAEKS